MANKKFSQFTNQPSTANTFLVGYDGSTNVRIPVTDSLFQGGTYAIDLDDSLSNVIRAVSNGVTRYFVTHNLNNLNIIVSVIKKVTPYAFFKVYPSVRIDSLNVTEIHFGGTVNNNDYRIVIKY